jgi:hypothetical protein
MILKVKNAEYKDGYTVFLTFNNGEEVFVDPRATIMNDQRKIFLPLQDVNYFQNFRVKLNTIVGKMKPILPQNFCLN